MDEMLPKGEVGEKIRDIVEMLKTTGSGDMTITLAGAHAKGLADELSDIDIYLYYEAPNSYETNKQIITKFADNGNILFMTRDHVSAEFGGSYCFHYRGTLVEVTTRLYKNALKRIYESINGHFEIIPTDWTINGYYTFTYASEISYVKPVWDSSRFIENMKKIIYPYPQTLKKKIIEVFGQRMMYAPFHNYEYINAIKRRDLFMVNYFVTSTLLSMVQVIYALNNAYFTGDKQITKKLAALPYCPVEWLDNIEFLLSIPNDCDKLEQQRELLCNIAQELNEQCKALAWDAM
jgi:predicted nucleotidyltransferase